ncbi:MAG: hypothetical protein H0T76_20775 [Nannocystis sp.]|nr:hypothetical protein [Nannocystis sp.]MBA3548924.1 hypothetical protein [Nannocystis sp.]
MKTDNHFITVSRTGELMARRKGGAPVCVATAATGIEAETDDAARANGAPARVRVHFAPGGSNRRLNVTAVEVDGVVLDVDVFLARFAVPEVALGRWLRAAVDRALDAR